MKISPIRLINSTVANNNLRKLILIFIDLFCINISIFLSFFLNKDTNNLNIFSIYSLILVFISLPTYYSSGQYKGLSRYLGSSEIYKIIFRVTFNLIIFFLIINLTDFKSPQINFYIILWFLLNFITASTKFILRDFLIYLNKIYLNNIQAKEKVYIYGAGAAGIQLASAILVEGNTDIKGFLDDNSQLWGRTLKGVKIYPPSVLEKNNKRIDKILFAISSISKLNKKKLLKKVQKFGIKTFQTPSVRDLTNGRYTINELRPIEIEDLLGRDVIVPKKDLLVKDIKNNTICVTGAGGSIGKELCRQILELNPKTLILFELSEVSLFKISQELMNLISDDNYIQIKCILGNALDEELVKSTFIENNVDIVFHAAAYKHVPLVEENPLSGLLNNIFSTKTLCECARESNVKKFILISSDKAVRPTNIMGVSKRISELVVQAFAYESKEINKNKNHLFTNFSMVRFGNVLNSSGSVVPLFSKQISEGGPLTLTHPKVIRYFMTIPEAAQLVIQSCTLAKGGEVFLLDMGEPVNIKDLAIQMIKLSGMTVKDSNNINGDIEIKITGLRPGEKLFEELLIDGKSERTSHPLIYKAKEKFISGDLLLEKLRYLKKYIDANDKAQAIKLALSIIPENMENLIK